MCFYRKMKLSLISLFLTIGVAFATQKIRYDGFKVYKVVPLSSMQLEALRYLENNDFGYNFWSGVSHLGKPVHIMVPPHMEHKFADFLKLQGLGHELYIDNVQEKIDNEQPKTKANAYGWTSYYRLADVNI